MSRAAIVAPVYPNRDAQEVENHRVIAAVADVTEIAVSTSDHLLSYVEGRLPPLQANGARVLEAVETLSKRYRFEAPAGWDEARFMIHCNQAFSTADIAALLGRPFLDHAVVAQALQQLQLKDLPRGRYLVMRDNLRVLNAHRGPDGVVDLAEALAALHDIQHVDPTAEIRSELKDMDLKLKKYLKLVSDAANAYEAAVASGQVVEVERTHRHLIAARYELTVCCAERLHFLESTANDDSVIHFSDRLEQLKKDAEDGVAGFKAEKDKLSDAIQCDMNRCQEARKTEDDQHNAAKAAFSDAKRGLSDELSQLVSQKGALIREIMEKVEALRDVMERQRQVSRKTIDLIRVEAQRQTAYEEFVNIHEQHRRRLGECLHYCESCKPVIKDMERFVATMVEELPVDEAQQALDAITDAEVDTFMGAYREFVFSCGELTVKKTHRLDTLERHARLLEHNRGSAMDSLDPNMEHYRAEMKDVVAQMKAVEGVINALLSTQDAGEQVFESVEEQVLETYERTNRIMVHPLQEMGFKTVTARSTFVDRSMKYVEGEEQAVTHKRLQIEDARATVDQDQAAVDRILAAGGTNADGAAGRIEA